MTVTVIGENTGDDFSGTEDTYISSLAVDTNYGPDAGFNIRVSPLNGLLRFTGISNISSSDTVSAITEGIYCYQEGGTDQPAEYYRCLRAWVEAEATYNIYSTGNSWATAGGRGTGDSEVSSHGATANITGVGWFTASDAGLVTFYQNIIDGTNSNEGQIILSNSGGSDRIRSSEGTDGQRPYLSVTHAAVGGAVSANDEYYKTLLSMGDL